MFIIGSSYVTWFSRFLMRLIGSIIHSRCFMFLKYLWQIITVHIDHQVVVLELQVLPPFICPIKLEVFFRQSLRFNLIHIS